MKSGAVSKDFPLHHNKFIPTYQNPNEKKYTHNKSIINNTYTNEHPDLFRLDGMKEGGYFNPFLNQIIKVDRNEYYKKLSLDRKNINFIDFMKTHRQYSQNPKLTRYISSGEQIELKRKRMALKNKNLSYTRNDSNCNNHLLTEINKNNDLKNNYNKEYNNLIKTLNHFVPKIDLSLFLSDMLIRPSKVVWLATLFSSFISNFSNISYAFSFETFCMSCITSTELALILTSCLTASLSLVSEILSFLIILFDSCSI